MSDKRQEVLRIAGNLYQQEPDWLTFFREILGLQGAVRQAYQSPEDLIEFEQTEEFQKIQKMLAQLRERGVDVGASTKEPTRVITVRLPQSLHESLRAEAHDRNTSMNRLCISKLLQVVDSQLVPAEAETLSTE